MSTEIFGTLKPNAGSPLSIVDGGGNVIPNVKDPVNPQDAATKSFVAVAVASGTPVTTVQIIGSGHDGALTVSSGLTTLTRDANYTNVTPTGTAQIAVADYRLFWNGVLDTTGAPSSCVTSNGPDGIAAVADVAGTAPLGAPFNTMGGSTPGLAGVAGTTGVGGSPPATVQQLANGGAAGPSGAGGLGSSGAGGTFRSGNNPLGVTPQYRWVDNFYRVTSSGIQIVGGGCSGPGGGAGAGDGTNKGGGSGSAASGAGTLYCSGNVLARNTTTGAGAFQAKGGRGGNGGSAAAGNCGGGAAAPGGGGGSAFIAYVGLSGAPKTGLIDVSGGDGGNGGNGIGTGRGGQGGCGSANGRCLTLNLTTGTPAELAPGVVASSATTPATTAGSAGTAGTAGLVTL